MKAFYIVKRVDRVLWAKMYTDCKGDWYAVNRPVENGKEAKAAFADFVNGVRDEVRNGT